VCASTVLSLGLQELVQRSELIVLGICEEMSSTWNKDRNAVFSYIRVIPEKCLKGSHFPTKITIEQLGGIVDNVSMTVVGEARFVEGERVILMLRKSSETCYRIIGLSQGKFSVIRRGDAFYVQRNLRELTLVKQENGEIRLHKGPAREKEIDLDTFIRKIEFYLRNP
jgi:hypothetical protein